MGKKVNDRDFLILHYLSHVPYFSGHANLGDYVQSIAIKYVLRKIYNPQFKYHNRDSLSFYKSENDNKKILCLMQGWFGHTLNFLPSNDILPIWIGVHFSQPTERVIQKLLCVRPNYFKKSIGCRDLTTLDFCRSMGLESYFSRCCTLLFDTLDCLGTEIVLVNVPSYIENKLPNYIKNNAIKVNQRWVNIGNEGWNKTFDRADELLSLYAQKAKLVLTTALHVASPCIAMGIPVILIVENEIENPRRFSTLSGIIKTVTIEDIQNGNVNFEPEPINIEYLKRAMLENIKLTIDETLGKKVDESELRDVRKEIEDFSV